MQSWRALRPGAAGDYNRGRKGRRARAQTDLPILIAGCAAAKGDYRAAFLAYQQQRYLRTARVQLTARLYGDIYHATDAVRDLRRQMLAGRAPQQAYNGMAWLYDGI